MDWPISWQKVKDNGSYEILDLKDYGVSIDGSSDIIEVAGTQLLDDITQVVKSGKTIAVKMNLSVLMGTDADLLVPAISYTVDEGGNVHQVVGLTSNLGFIKVPIWVWMYRNSDANTTVLKLALVREIPSPIGTMETKYVLTSWDGAMSWELGDYLIDLSSVAVATGLAINIEDMAANVLNAYSRVGKNLTAKFKYIDPTDSENEITQVVGLNLMVTNHTINGTTTMAYTASVGGMFFSIYKEGSSWKYTISQQS